MSLTIQQIGGFNPFEWDELKCPLCHGNKYTSLSHAGVYCDCCNARFVVRDTAGDPGCVIDCHLTREQGAFIYAPSYCCPKCPGDDARTRHGLFDHEDKTCKLNLNHGAMVRESGISVPWKLPKGMERYCLILKLGDYISGWMQSGSSKRIDGPTQEQWDAYQEVMHQNVR